MKLNKNGCFTLNAAIRRAVNKHDYCSAIGAIAFFKSNKLYPLDGFGYLVYYSILTSQIVVCLLFGRNRSPEAEKAGPKGHFPISPSGPCCSRISAATHFPHFSFCRRDRGERSLFFLHFFLLLWP